MSVQMIKICGIIPMKHHCYFVEGALFYLKKPVTLRCVYASLTLISKSPRTQALYPSANTSHGSLFSLNLEFSRSVTSDYFLVSNVFLLLFSGFGRENIKRLFGV